MLSAAARLSGWIEDESGHELEGAGFPGGATFEGGATFGDLSTGMFARYARGRDYHRTPS